MEMRLGMTLVFLLIIYAVHQTFAWNVMDAASESLKGHYQERFGYTLENSLADVLHERVFVNLTLVPKKRQRRTNSQKKTTINENEDYILKNNVNERNVEPSRIFSKNNKFAFIRGVGGVGKTHLIEQMALQWANGTLWTDVRYLFVLTCHEIKSLRGVPTIEILLYLLYGNVFQYLTYADIIKKSNETLLLIDGLEECVSINSKKDKTKYDFVRLIDPTFNQLRNTRVIITGRPESANYLDDENFHYVVKTLELLGFTERNVNTFIEKSLKHDTNTIRTVKELLVKNDNLHRVARIPAYLKLICEISGNQNYIVLETVKDVLKTKQLL